MAVNFQYHYAIVDKTMGYLCLEVCTTSVYSDGYESETQLYVAIEVYSDQYLMKYYNRETNQWFYDAAMTQEFILEV